MIVYFNCGIVQLQNIHLHKHNPTTAQILMLSWCLCLVIKWLGS